MRLFKESGFSVKGNILPIDKFRMMLDWDNPTFDEKKMAKVVAKAEEYLDYEITTITLTQYRQYHLSGVLSHFSSPYQERGRIMFTLGMAEAYERQGRFTDKLCDVIWAILEESTWVLPQHAGHIPYRDGGQVPPVVGDKYLHGIELGSAYRTASMAVVYTYCKDILDAVSPIIGERMVYEMKKRTLTPFLNANFSWSGAYDGKCNNWCPWNISNILLTTALIEERMHIRERIVAKAMDFVDNFVDGYKPDGGCNEGATYWQAAGGSLFDCLETLYDMTGGKLDLFDNDLVRKMGEYEANMNIAGKNFVNFADGSPTFVPPANLMSRYGKRCGSAVLESFGNYMATYNDLDFAYAHPYRSIRSIYTPSVEGEVPAPKAYVANYMPYLKVATFRDSEVANEGMFLAIKGGHNRESHNHNDVGSFIVYKEGKPVLIDTGCGTYTRDTFGPNRYTIWTMQSKYHNLPMFGGEGEMQGQKYESRDEVYDEAKKSISMELAGAYPASYGINSYKRTASLNDGVVKIVDCVDLAAETEVDFILMTHVEPKETDDGILLAEGCLLNYDKALTYELEVFDPVGMDAVAKWGTPVLYRMHFKTKCRTGEFTFTINGKEKYNG